MIVDLPSTTTVAISKKLVALRQDTGAMALGRVLTLLIVVDEKDAEEAIEAANDASRQHPCRIIAVVLGNRRGQSRIDAQIRVGGDAGASEVVVLRLHGALSQHARSVVIPLLLPDSPVVAWWPKDAPTDVAADPIGAMAQRRITDAAESKNPRATLKSRAK
ncbi:MAG TPA: glucose-6-phosphate dehydrogenase assembly protein OpcA, partial [Pedococcus sp.]|nr:glucose-6-phosphate dehydrogenase assembly protein OpcA [Pedococcus sp.]